MKQSRLGAHGVYGVDEERKRESKLGCKWEILLNKVMEQLNGTSHRGIQGKQKRIERLM